MLRTDGSGHRGAEEASALAVQALTFVANDPTELNRFLQLSGLEPNGIRTAAADPAFFAGLLDYVLGNEKTLGAFCAEAGLDPQAVVSARAALSPNFEAGPR